MPTTVSTPRKIATTVTANATLAKGRHTPVNATSGALTMTLPTDAVAGVEIAVEKIDASANDVTITGTLRGVASSTITLTSQFEARTLLSEGAGSWRPTSDHRTAASLGQGRQSVRVYDDFTGQANGAIAGRTPIAGAAWRTTGANPNTVTSGSATSAGTGYMYQTLTDKVRIVMCEVAFTSTASSMTMAATLTDDSTMLDNIGVHFNFGATSFNVTSRRDASGSFVSYPAMFGNWQRPLATDGSETGRFWLLIRRDTVTIIGPDGIPHSATSPVVGQLSGNTVFWEPNTGALMKSCMAIASTTSAQQSLVDMLLDYAATPLLDDKGRVNGNLGGYGEVQIGLDSALGLPSITFGPTRVYTRLTSAIAAGVTTLPTADKIPNGSSVVIETGNAAETVTRDGAGPGTTGGTSPYTGTLTAATTKAHPANSLVIATPVNSWQRATVTFNPETGVLQMPDVAFGSFAYLSGRTAYMNQPVSGVVGFGGAGTGKGAIKAGTANTATRPTAVSVSKGAQMYDVDLNKPIWSDGTVWRDATGTAV